MQPDDTVYVRRARPADAPALVPLLAQLGFPAPEEVVAERLDALLTADEAVLIAERAGEVVGLLTVHVTPVLHRPTPVGRLTALVVAEPLRGTGVGRALVAAAERLLAERGCGLVEVTSNRALVDAHRFYERIGYDITSFRFGKRLPAE